MKVVGIGNPVYDCIKTPCADSRNRVLSGCSTNACIALRRLGATAHLVGCVGTDFRESLEESLWSYEIEHTLYPSTYTGGFNLVYFDDDGNRTLDILGIADDIKQFPEEIVSASDYVVIGPILGETSIELMRAIHKSASGTILLDPQGMLRKLNGLSIEHYKNEMLLSALWMFGIVKANELETRLLTGINPSESEDALRAATIVLQAMGNNIAVVTMAAAGSAAYDGRQYFRVPAYPVRAIDPTGAGDTYAAGFLYGLDKYGGIKEACCFGSSVASVMVENLGPDFVLQHETVQKRFKEIMRQCDG